METLCNIVGINNITQLYIMDIVDIVDIIEPLWNILQCRASQCFEENQRIFSAGASEQRVFQRRIFFNRRLLDWSWGV